MDFLLNWFLFVGVNLIALASPGPDFVMAIRNSIRYGRAAGIWTAAGFALGIAVHVSYTFLGLAAVIAKSVALFTLIKLVGAAYLFFIGYQAIRSQGFERPGLSQESQMPEGLSWFIALRQGFVTNVFNPKATLFFLAVISQFVTTETPPAIFVLYGATSIILTFFWFATISVVMSAQAIRSQFFKISKWVDRACGVVFIALGIKLALQKL